MTTMRPRQSDNVRSELLQLVALHGMDNRAALAARTGISQSAVGGHVEALIEAGALIEVGLRATGSRGRPVYELAIAPDTGLVLVAELGIAGARLAVGSLDGNLKSMETIEFQITDGPAAVLATITDRLRTMLESYGETILPVRGLVVALPGPVDDLNGTVVRPSLMPGWDGYPVASEMSARFCCPVEVHNDVNMMAAGEALSLDADELPMIYLKVGSGLGCGIVLPDGSLLHGKHGSAGDIAHIPAPGRPDVLCECGNVGCMDAVASVRAIIQQLEQVPGVLGDQPRTSRTIVDLLQRGDPHAVRAMRDAAATLGEAVVLLVHLFNPATILVGGLVAIATDDVVASIRGTVYQRAQPLATRSLSIRQGALKELAGVTGSMRRAVEMAFSPDAVREVTGR